YFARFRPQRRPYGPHDQLIHGSRQSVGVRGVFAQRLAPGVYGQIDRRGGAEVHPLRLTLRRKQIDEVARRAPLSCPWLPRGVERELDQGAVGWYRRLDC